MTFNIIEFYSETYFSVGVELNGFQLNINTKILRLNNYQSSKNKNFGNRKLHFKLIFMFFNNLAVICMSCYTLRQI